jgi:hypothetical protein
MPDQKGKDKATDEDIPDSSLHAYKSGEEDEVERPLNETGEPDADEVKKTGGATSGGPGDAADGEEDTPADEEDTPDDDEETGGKGLGSESGALGGEKSPPNNPDPSTKGATKGTEGAL